MSKSLSKKYFAIVIKKHNVQTKDVNISNVIRTGNCGNRK